MVCITLNAFTDEEIIKELRGRGYSVEKTESATGAFVIINWSCINDVSPVYNEDGTVMAFDTHKDAEKYAEEELNHNWQIISV